MMRTMKRRDWIILLAVTLLAAALRFYQLGVIPPGPQFDEAFNAIDAEQVMDGNRPLFMPANAGREVVYTYLQAGVGALLGLNLYTLRLVSALAGILTVPAVYLLVRRLFQRDSQWMAMFTALALAISYWHIHFSHYGIRVILMPLIFSGVFGCFWLGMHGGSRRVRLLAVLASGALTGLGVWTNPTGRFVPFVLVAYVAWLLWRYPDRRRLRLDSPLGGLALAGAVALIVFLPLGLEFVRHPDFFFGHASEVSVFAERVSGQMTPLALLANNTLRVLGMFGFTGDQEWAHGIAGRPVFDWLMAAVFYGGVVIWVLRLLGRGARSANRVSSTDPAREDGRPADPDRDALVLFALWAIVMLAPSVLSEAAPNYSRTLPAIPALMIAPGLALTWLATRPRLQPRAGPLLAGAIVVTSLVITVYDYFVRFPTYPEVYYVYDADKADAVNWLKAQTDANVVYLSPLWSSHATVTFLHGRGIKALDTAETIVLPPPGKGAVYAFPAEQGDLADDMADIWDAQVEWINDRFGHPLLAVVKVDAAKVAQWPPGRSPAEELSAKFDDAPTLIGMKPGRSGRNFLLYWQAEQKTYRDLTSFVHLVDERNRQVGQIDKLPGNGFYRTPSWWPGERVIERYAPEITDLCSGGERVRVLTGWYEYAANGQRRPRLDAPGDTALAGELVMPFLSVPVDQVQPPQPVTAHLTDDLTLLGYGLENDVWEPGMPLTLELYLTGKQSQDDRMLSVELRGPAGTAELWSGALAPGAEWRDGEALCRRVRARVPVDLAPGDYTLAVTVDGADHALTAGHLDTVVAPFRPAAARACAGRPIWRGYSLARLRRRGGEPAN